MLECGFSVLLLKKDEYRFNKLFQRFFSFAENCLNLEEKEKLAKHTKIPTALVAASGKNQAFDWLLH
jgi:hypothetical protein